MQFDRREVALLVEALRNALDDLDVSDEAATPEVVAGAAIMAIILTMQRAAADRGVVEVPDELLPPAGLALTHAMASMSTSGIAAARSVFGKLVDLK